MLLRVGHRGETPRRQKPVPSKKTREWMAEMARILLIINARNQVWLLGGIVEVIVNGGL
jgi:hypothetical protein